MQLRSSLLLPLFLATSPLPTLVSADGRGHHNHPHSTRAGSSVFPFLTWVRDSAVQIIFGQHPAKVTTAPRPEDLVRQYKNEIIVRFNVTTAEEERALAKATERLFLDIWSGDGTVDLRINRKLFASFLDMLPESLHSSFRQLVEDLPSAVQASYAESIPWTSNDYSQFELGFSIDLNKPRTPHRGGDEGAYFFRNYQPHRVVVRWMRLVEAMFPSFVQFTSIGQTYEGREIPALKVRARKSPDESSPRKTLVVMGGSHAREWISTTTVNYLAWSFITSLGKDRLITKFLQSFDIVFIPELNPDGIEYTWNVDRLWRKSRQHTSTLYCRGLDLDRAFGFGWDSSEGGHQNDPCSESFGGDEPWESVEVTAFRDWAKNEIVNNDVQFVGLIDLHSYSQQILFPYSYTCDREPRNVERMEELALGLAKTIRLVSGEHYSVKQACEGVVPEINGAPGRLRIESGGGTAIDWFYHELGARYCYQIKLRDTGSYGFLLPSSYIVPTGEEILQSMKYLGDFLLGNDGIEHRDSDAASKFEKELHLMPEEYDEVQELKKRETR